MVTTVRHRLLARGGGGRLREPTRHRLVALPAVLSAGDRWRLLMLAEPRAAWGAGQAS